MENLSPISLFLLELSQKASDIMLKYYSPLGTLAQRKDDQSPTVSVDREINQMVIQEVQTKYPEYDVLAEEISTDTKKSSKLFVVDPLDGTAMFSRGAPLFGFSAAVVENGTPVAGVLVNPLAKRTLIAEKGKGAFLVETKSSVRVSTRETLEKALINTGFKEGATTTLLHERGAHCPEVYTFCESAMLVSLGGFDGSIVTSRFPYDVAASKVIVEEAGGKVTDLNGNEQRYDQVVHGAVVSNGTLHKQLLEIVKTSGIINSAHTFLHPFHH